MRWTVVIPAKALPAAKSRLLPATSDPAAHRRLVESIRADTVAAALAADGVARVLFVVDRPWPVPANVLVLQQTLPGLNPALSEAAEHAARQWPQDGIAALVGDLPALRPDELADALARAAGTAGMTRAFVPDLDGTGTTLLAVPPGAPLLPRFGPGSAARHREIATELAAGDGLRRDVDTAQDLASARQLTLGPATTRALLDAGDVTARST